MKNVFGIYKSWNQSSLKGTQELSRIEPPAQNMVDTEFRPVTPGNTSTSMNNQRPRKDRASKAEEISQNNYLFFLIHNFPKSYS